MNNRKNLETALAKLGITNDAELNAAIQHMKPVNLFLMIEEQQERKAG